MPKDTFFNLPEEKKRLIEKTAVSEFAGSGFEKASISRIVDKCGIAKGSFYQYFEDKKDLYFYLIGRLGEKKLKALAPVIEKRSQYDFFGFIRQLFLEGLKFAANNPEITMMGDWLFKNRDHPLYKELMDMGTENAQDVYDGLIKDAIRRGEVRDDIDPAFISHTLSILSVSSIEYYFQIEEGRKARVKRFDERMMDVIDKLIDLLKNGIGTPEKGGIYHDRS